MQTAVSFFGTVYVVFSPLWSATMHVQTVTAITCFDNWKKSVNVIIMSSLFCHSWAHLRPFICKGDPPSEMLLPLEKTKQKLTSAEEYVCGVGEFWCELGHLDPKFNILFPNLLSRMTFSNRSLKWTWAHYNNSKSGVLEKQFLLQWKRTGCFS